MKVKIQVLHSKFYSNYLLKYLKYLFYRMDPFSISTCIILLDYYYYYYWWKQQVNEARWGGADFSLIYIYSDNRFIVLVIKTNICIIVNWIFWTKQKHLKTSPSTVGTFHLSDMLWTKRWIDNENNCELQPWKSSMFLPAAPLVLYVKCESAKLSDKCSEVQYFLLNIIFTVLE